MACATPLRTRAAQSLTGAAQTWLVVNMPATVAGSSERMNARSGLFPFWDPLPVPRRLISQNTPEARNPFGAVIEPGTEKNGGDISTFVYIKPAVSGKPHR